MKVYITLMKTVDDEDDAKEVFGKVKKVAAIDLDMTMAGYTNHELNYDEIDPIDPDD